MEGIGRKKGEEQIFGIFESDLLFEETREILK